MKTGASESEDRLHVMGEVFPPGIRTISLGRVPAYLGDKGLTLPLALSALVHVVFLTLVFGIFVGGHGPVGAGGSVVFVDISALSTGPRHRGAGLPSHGHISMDPARGALTLARGHEDAVRRREDTPVSSARTVKTGLGASPRHLLNSGPVEALPSPGVTREGGVLVKGRVAMKAEGGDIAIKTKDREKTVDPGEGGTGSANDAPSNGGLHALGALRAEPLRGAKDETADNEMQVNSGAHGGQEKGQGLVVASISDRAMSRPLLGGAAQLGGKGSEGAEEAAPGRGAGQGHHAGPSGTGSGVSIRGLRAPAYPLISRLRGEEGTVEIGVEIGPGGALLSARVSRSSGFASLDRAALKAVRAARFSARGIMPGASPYKKNIVFVFRLKDRREN